MGNSSSKESLSGSGGPVKKDTFRLRDTGGLVELGMLDGQFNDILDFLNLLLESSNHIVGRIWYLLNLHQGD